MSTEGLCRKTSLLLVFSDLTFYPVSLSVLKYVTVLRSTETFLRPPVFYLLKEEDLSLCQDLYKRKITSNVRSLDRNLWSRSRTNL